MLLVLNLLALGNKKGSGYVNDIPRRAVGVSRRLTLGGSPVGKMAFNKGSF